MAKRIRIAWLTYRCGIIAVNAVKLPWYIVPFAHFLLFAMFLGDVLIGKENW